MPAQDHRTSGVPATPGRRRRVLLAGLIGLAALVVLLVGVRLAVGAVDPPALGSTDGSLEPCPAADNCVSSQAEAARHAVEPLVCPERRADQLAGVLDDELPRSRVVTATDVYAHIEVRSRIVGFVDDLELLVDDEVVHVRSAARLGRNDLGVNAARVDEVRRITNDTAACG